MTAAIPAVLMLSAAGEVGPGIIAHFEFEKGADGFALQSGQGQVRWATPSPLQGVGSLRLELTDKARDMRVASPAFAVQPWRILRVTFSSQLDRGLVLAVLVGIRRGQGWWELRTTASPDGFRFGTPPGATEARVELLLTAPGQVLGRSALVDAIRVTDVQPIVREGSVNLYWDGSLEVSEALPPTAWSFWGRPPDKVEYATGHAQDGRRFLRVRGRDTYVVLPSVPVKPYRLYRLTYWVRGIGTIWPGLHKLSPTNLDSLRLDQAGRIGWATGEPATVNLRPDQWQQVEVVTPCEIERPMWFQPYFALRDGTVEIDAVVMQSLAGPEADRRP